MLSRAVRAAPSGTAVPRRRTVAPSLNAYVPGASAWRVAALSRIAAAATNVITTERTLRYSTSRSAAGAGAAAAMRRGDGSSTGAASADGDAGKARRVDVGRWGDGLNHHDADSAASRSARRSHEHHRRDRRRRVPFVGTPLVAPAVDYPSREDVDDAGLAVPAVDIHYDDYEGDDDDGDDAQSFPPVDFSHAVSIAAKSLRSAGQSRLLRQLTIPAQRGTPVVGLDVSAFTSHLHRTRMGGGRLWRATCDAATRSLEMHIATRLAGPDAAGYRARFWSTSGTGDAYSDRDAARATDAPLAGVDDVPKHLRLWRPKHLALALTSVSRALRDGLVTDEIAREFLDLCSAVTVQDAAHFAGADIAQALQAAALSNEARHALARQAATLGTRTDGLPIDTIHSIAVELAQRRLLAGDVAERLANAAMIAAPDLTLKQLTYTAGAFAQSCTHPPHGGGRGAGAARAESRQWRGMPHADEDMRQVAVSQQLFAVVCSEVASRVATAAPTGGFVADGGGHPAVSNSGGSGSGSHGDGSKPGSATTAAAAGAMQPRDWTRLVAALATVAPTGVSIPRDVVETVMQAAVSALVPAAPALQPRQALKLLVNCQRARLHSAVAEPLLNAAAPAVLRAVDTASTRELADLASTLSRWQAQGARKSGEWSGGAKAGSELLANAVARALSSSGTLARCSDRDLRVIAETFSRFRREPAARVLLQRLTDEAASRAPRLPVPEYCAMIRSLAKAKVTNNDLYRAAADAAPTVLAGATMRQIAMVAEAAAAATKSTPASAAHALPLLEAVAAQATRSVGALLQCRDGTFARVTTALYRSARDVRAGGSATLHLSSAPMTAFAARAVSAATEHMIAGTIAPQDVTHSLLVLSSRTPARAARALGTATADFITAHAAVMSSEQLASLTTTLTDGSLAASVGAASEPHSRWVVAAAGECAKNIRDARVPDIVAFAAACADAGAWPHGFFVACADELERREALATMGAAEVARLSVAMTNAFINRGQPALADAHCAGLVRRATTLVRTNSGGLPTRTLSDIAWAFSRLGVVDEELWRHMAREGAVYLENAREPQGRVLALLADGVATAQGEWGVEHRDFSYRLARRVCDAAGSFAPSQLTSVLACIAQSAQWHRGVGGGGGGGGVDASAKLVADALRAAVPHLVRGVMPGGDGVGVGVGDGVGGGRGGAAMTATDMVRAVHAYAVAGAAEFDDTRALCGLVEIALLPQLASLSADELDDLAWAFAQAAPGGDGDVGGDVGTGGVRALGSEEFLEAVHSEQVRRGAASAAHR